MNCPTDAVGGILKNDFEDAAPSYGEGEDLPAKALDRLLEQPRGSGSRRDYNADARQTVQGFGDVLETGTEGGETINKSGQ